MPQENSPDLVVEPHAQLKTPTFGVTLRMGRMPIPIRFEGQQEFGDKPRAHSGIFQGPVN